jgi:hypothetical protein
MRLINLIISFILVFAFTAKLFPLSEQVPWKDSGRSDYTPEDEPEGSEPDGERDNFEDYDCFKNYPDEKCDGEEGMFIPDDDSVERASGA